jgi:alkyl hydroperoxide reductase subunit AhpC/protein-arginine kinase
MELNKEKFGEWSEGATDQDNYNHWNSAEDLERINWNQNSDCAVPGPSKSSSLDSVNANGEGEKKIAVADFKGKFLVIIFFKNNDSKEFLKAFSDLADLFRGNKIELIACSRDSCSSTSSWLKSSWSGSCKIPICSDPQGAFTSQYDLWDDNGFCRDGLVIIDDMGMVRQAMTSALEPMDTAKSILDVIGLLRKHKVDARDLQQAGSKSTGSRGRACSPVTLDRGQMEASWDVSTDPELQKVLNKARMLGQAKPVKIQQVSRTPQFNLTADQIRKNLKNPVRGAPVRWCSATLHRNLTGFGKSGDMLKDQKVKLENLIKKVMGVAYMPEDLTGKYTCLSTMNQREQAKFLESDIFSMSGDSWMKEPGSVEWTAGKGVFVNNYSNFILWVGLDDQLRFVSLAKGTDLKYVLLRLQKAVSRIEEALKMVFSTKSCNERGFTNSNGSFTHSKRGVYGTGFETTFTIDLPGFGKAEKSELEKAANELFLDIVKGRSGSLYTVSIRQSIEDGEEEIVKRSVESLDNLYMMDRALQAKLGIKIDQTGRSL